MRRNADRVLLAFFVGVAQAALIFGLCLAAATLIWLVVLAVTGSHA